MNNRIPVYLIIGFFVLQLSNSALAGNLTAFEKTISTNITFLVDSPEVKLPYPIRDLDPYGNPYVNNIDLEDPPNLEQNIVYDPETGEYRLSQSLSGMELGTPTYQSYEEYVQNDFDNSVRDYWRQRSAGENLVYGGDGIIPSAYVGGELFNRLFGGTNIDIRPSGNLELTFGGNFQKVDNPILTEQQRTNGGFDFDMAINMNALGQIGEKMKLTMAYNTQSTFNFENQVKLEYTGYEDEIIKRIEAGNVHFNTNSSLITGSQSLFGLKTQMQFGRTTITNVLSQRKSQAENLTIQGGAESQLYELKADEYDENRHFFLGHYFRDNYNEALENLPIVNSQIQITRLEVWVTSRNSTGTEVERDVVGFMDLAEKNPFDTNFANNGIALPNTVCTTPNDPLTQSFASNSLYQLLTNESNSDARNLETVNSFLQQDPDFELTPTVDFEKTFAKQLSPSEYSFDPQLGYISLNRQLQPYEVLAVSYQYTENGKTYQVGEFSENVPVDPQTPNVLFLKLLKSTVANPRLPIWDLMMKNVYNIGAFQISREDFKLDILYQEPGGGENRFLPLEDESVSPVVPGLPAGSQFIGVPLISALGMDRLNIQQDPQPDGVFDFIQGITINTQNGRVIFPVVEPFGDDLRELFGPVPNFADDFVYDILYDSTLTVAQQFPEFNRYSIEGRYKSSVSSEIALGAFNIPQGSVTVTAGGQQLIEGQDYTVDYNIGRLRVLNESVLNSGIPINVNYENNALFGFQTKTMIGTRLDYWINDNMSLGATHMLLSEKPFTQKVNIGDDPISNNIVGLDLNFQSESPFLTKLVDAIPLYSTNAPSNVSVTAEAARLIPGHNRAIGDEGIVYLDDFEGSESGFDLKFPNNRWVLASTPKDAGMDGAPLFPEADSTNAFVYNDHRALLAWYGIDPLFNRSTSGTPDHLTANDRSNHYTREIGEQEVFPNRQNETGVPINIRTFDLAFYPNERGPYNFTVDGIDLSNTNELTLTDPQANWGGVMRSLETTDFEAANVEFLEFWMMDPFDNNPGATGGEMYFNLGNVSEDVLKDSRRFFENGLPPAGSTANIDTTTWGKVPVNPSVTNSFDNDPAVREAQDIGFDGLTDAEEVDFFADYINELTLRFGTGSPIVQTVLQDPSNDDYHYYRGDDYDTEQLSILERYKRFNGAEGNSPVFDANTTDQNFSTAATTLPDSEDLNQDNTLNEAESYFEYKVNLNPADLDIDGNNFITDVRTFNATFANDQQDEIKWYQFKIPVRGFDRKVGSIQDFKSIRFIRVYLTGFEEPVIVRFAKLDLVRNQWRGYERQFDVEGQITPPPPNENTIFNVSSVSVEENSAKEPVNYIIPPGIEREVNQNTINQTLINEQSLAGTVCELDDGDSRGVYKTLNLDLRRFKRLKMFIHAESVVNQRPLNDNEMVAFVRIGDDFQENYYEYEIPLTLTPEGQYNPDIASDRETVWPEENNLDIPLDSLVIVKQLRNNSGQRRDSIFTLVNEQGNRYSVIGNPDLGLVRSVMLGIRNPLQGNQLDPNDTGDQICGEVWFNELRVSDFDEEGGYAALARADFSLADFGSLSLSGNMHTQGFGALEQRIENRYTDDYYQYDGALNLDLGKFFGENTGIRLPIYAGYSKSISDPQYDPFETDVIFKDKVSAARDNFGSAYADSIQSAARNETTIKSFNVTNVRKVRTNSERNARIYDVENLNASFAYNETNHHDPEIEDETIKNYSGSLGYNYNANPKYIEPLKNIKGKYLKILKDFNINPIPSNISVRTDIRRRIGVTQDRAEPENPFRIEPRFDKDFTWDRFYAFKWNLTKSLNVDFNANTNARIDEPDGYIDTDLKRDTVWNNIKDFGRTTNYRHSFNTTYKVPIDKIPILSFVKVTARYGGDYGWTGASLNPVAQGWGNTIQNSQNISLNNELNLRNLYEKSKFLKKYSNPKPNTQRGAEDYNVAAGFFVKLLTSVKRVSLNYTQNKGTILPGFNVSPEFLGLGDGGTAPGYDFVFGLQPDRNTWLDNTVVANNWLTSDTTLNNQFRQDFTRRIDGRINVEPFKDFRVDINMDRSFSENHTQLFKKLTPEGPFEHLNPRDNGSFSISYFSLGTLFNDIGSGDLPKTFQNLEDNRIIISRRLGEENPNSNQLVSGFYEGYGEYSPDVLIPSFIAAYSGQSAESVDINDRFLDFPRPNWRLTYNGLSRLPFFQKFLTNVNLTHGYRSTLTMNSYNSSLYYQPDANGVQFIIDSLSGNYYPVYDIPNLSISEQLSPLIGLDMTWKNSLTSRFEYRKSRQIGLSLQDYQLSESKTTEFTVGAGYRIKEFVFPIKFGGRQRDLKNDLDIRCDLSWRDQTTVNYKLDQDFGEPTSGTETLSIRPTVDYVLNNRLNMRLFYDLSKTTPKVSSSFPITNTRAGLNLRFSLSQ